MAVTSPDVCFPQEVPEKVVQMRHLSSEKD